MSARRVWKSQKVQWGFLSALLAPAFILLAGCQAAPAEETIVETVLVTEILEGESFETIVTEEVVEEPVLTAVEAEGTPASTTIPAPSPTSGIITVEVTTTPVPDVYEARRVVLEWPPEIPMGESAIVRLSFNPDSGELDAGIEIQGAQVATGSVDVRRLPQYDVRAAASLDGLGFEIAPAGEQVRLVTEGEPLEWRWTVSPLRDGVQRMNVLLALRWYPAGDTQTVLREAVLYAKGLEVTVSGAPILGGVLLGVSALALGSIFLFVLARGRIRRKASPERQPPLVHRAPNPDTALEPYPGIALNDEETSLFRSVFSRYGRVLLEREFESGYSGARTFLVQPLRPDGSADAHTILKIGPLKSVRQEYANYQRFVADTLPPITARIQHEPVALPNGELAALRYTFVAEPGRPPVSLRRQLLDDPDPGYLQRLFEVFGPGWWMQRRPYTFRLVQAYDRKLPVHAVLEPAAPGEEARLIHAGDDPATLLIQPGERLVLKGFSTIEPGDGYRTLIGTSQNGSASLRLRWISPNLPGGNPAGRVIATRETILRKQTHEMPRYGLPDPLLRLPELLNETMRGTRSIIHGDLNLENVLIGPGGMVWLIDFAMTGEGHTLYDFAHLGAELVAHVLAPKIPDPQAFLDILRSGTDPLLEGLRSIAARCLYDREKPGEYDRALALSCLGSLKYGNLESHQRHLLYLTAAWLLREA